MQLTAEPQIVFGNIRTSKKELVDLAKGWVAISIAFTMILQGFGGFSIVMVFLLSLITVGTGFVFHELAHKFVAQRYGCFAEFRSNDQMLVLAIVMSLFGFIFAAPGAVLIAGRVTTKSNGIISAAGPITNLVLATLFLGLTLTGTGFVAAVALYGFFINSWLAVFNMIPVWQFDGAKIWPWNKAVYLAIVAVGGLFLVLQFSGSLL